MSSSLSPPSRRGLAFDKPAQQEAYSRWWLSNRANVEPPPSLRIRWYSANYEPGIGGIIQSGKIDLAALVPPEERDVAILACQAELASERTQVLGLELGLGLAARLSWPRSAEPSSQQL